MEATENTKKVVVKPNKVPYILNRHRSVLVPRKRIDDAEKQIEIMHRDYDGKISLAITSNEPEFRTWSQYNFEIYDLLDVVWKFLGEKDVYISANGFWNNRRRLRDLRHLKAFVLDIDYYKEKKYEKKTQEEMYEILKNKEKKFFKMVGEPSLVINSGKGIYLMWLIESAPHMALPLWTLCMEKLFEQFKSYGADPKAKDAAHVYRLCGSRNSKNGKLVTLIDYDKKKDVKIYTLDHFRLKLLPNKFDKYIPAKERDNVKDKNGKLRKMTQTEISARQTASLYTVYKLHFTRIKDLEKLVELRQGDLEGYREKILFYYRYWNACYQYDTEKALEETLLLNNTFIEPLCESEVIEATSSAEEYYLHWKCTFDKFCEVELKEGVKKTQRQMNNFFYKEKCFIFTSEKIIDDLCITQDEMRDMETLFNKKEKNRRSQPYRNEWNKEKFKELRRNEEGRTSREQQKHEKMVIIAQMLEDGYKQKDIIEKTGYGKSTVSEYAKLLKTGEYVIEKENEIFDEERLYSLA